MTHLGKWKLDSWWGGESKRLLERCRRRDWMDLRQTVSHKPDCGRNLFKCSIQTGAGWWCRRLRLAGYGVSGGLGDGQDPWLSKLVARPGHCEGEKGQKKTKILRHCWDRMLIWGDTLAGYHSPSHKCINIQLQKYFQYQCTDLVWQQLVWYSSNAIPWGTWNAGCRVTLRVKLWPCLACNHSDIAVHFFFLMRIFLILCIHLKFWILVPKSYNRISSSQLAPPSVKINI